MERRAFEVHAVDQDGNVWIVASERKDTADGIAEKFKKEGYSEIRIVENDAARRGT